MKMRGNYPPIQACWEGTLSVTNGKYRQRVLEIDRGAAATDMDATDKLRIHTSASDSCTVSGDMNAKVV